MACQAVRHCRRLIERYVTQALLAQIAKEYSAGRALQIATADLDAGRQGTWNMGDIASSGTPAALELFRNGYPADPKTAIGPMASQRQYDRVQSYMRKGIEEGAEVLAGGEGQPEGLEAGYYANPTVFVNVKNNMTIAQEEICGPVLSVIAYDAEEDAIRIAKGSRYGLHAWVIGKDLQRARRVASQVRAGRVVINGITDDAQAPWGGFKYSGVGREYGTVRD